MYYVSTRDASLRYTAAQAIVQGLSREGGLFLPSEIPQLSREDLTELTRCSYPERAAHIMGLYLDDFSQKELLGFAEKAYGPAKFDTPAAAPVVKTEDGAYVMELWHGPTCAFKDMALQMLPYLLTASLRKTGEQKTVCILVATSGDTGKAALEGFRDVEHTKILVFYPDGGVSDIQKLQMVTQEGGNVGVCAVRGNFDDAQTGVKTLFSDVSLREELAARGYFLSSANSINWGRVLPQIVYYVSAYCDLVTAEQITMGEKVDVCVPTGNFGNILAAYIAKQMGLPVNKFICASNRNNVLTDFFKQDGEYNRNRDFYTTTSPSMDILISSNLERLLFFASDFDDRMVAELMAKLNGEGSYKVASDVFAKIAADFDAGCCDDEHAAETIHRLWTEEKYLCDTHTAVAVRVYEDYRARTGDETPTVIASTASPFKFCRAVIEALGGTLEKDDVTQLDVLTGLTGVPAPAPLAALAGKTPRFDRVVDKADILSTVALLKDL